MFQNPEKRFVKGHDFSRAESLQNKYRALAPAGMTDLPSHSLLNFLRILC
jgi:hypothetical protein